MIKGDLQRLADAVGVITHWEDSEGRPCQLSEPVLCELLARLGYPAACDSDIAASLQRQRGPTSPETWPPLITTEQGASTPLPSPLPGGLRFMLTLEQGERRAGRLDEDGTLPPVDIPGYHELHIGDIQLTLAVAPPRCFTPADACADTAPRLWGLAAQLYALRRAGDGGIGDTEALTQFVSQAAKAGAAAVAISPVHAMFSAAPERYSPYAPSSRLHYNVLYAAPEALLGRTAVDRAIEASGVADTLARCEGDTLLDWPAAAGAKLAWLRALCDDLMLREDAQAQRLRQALAAFRAAGGVMLENHCRFEALQQRLGIFDWRQWPKELQDPAGQEVIRFAEADARDVEFHAFLQWLASEGLARAQATARQAGMSIGLIADLAVGADAAGSQTWCRPREMLDGLSIGAPPDTFNVHGQDWGLVPFSPQGLARSGFRSFIDMLRTNFAHAGGLRIDHVLGLMRLWLVPHGAPPTSGGYVRYPLDDLLRLVALESWRHRAIVIGEDLGTVADGFRQRLEERGILGMRVLWFERDDEGTFLPPAQWSPEAMATSSTHDLPTLAGWWAGRDIEWRSRFGLLADDQDADSEQAERERDRARLASSLQLLDEDTPASALCAADLPVSQVLDACVCRLGLTPAPLTLLPVEDALGLEEQANLPGTLDEHPNWRRRWKDDANQLLNSSEVRQRLASLAQARRASRRAAQGDASNG